LSSVNNRNFININFYYILCIKCDVKYSPVAAGDLAAVAAARIKKKVTLMSPSSRHTQITII